ncbi:arylsulfatase [Rubinisphaera italica]|uniref:Arylsulfatase n=1 Tax=Rubinisphaera italica TaxID=2527969 RepID=A0A5C5XFB3_9PLAN|nr:arylsulfatase [Rubinisphaera italica]TWT61680.1 Arylsulfatase [Rubinisphaera italica]
MKASIRYSWRLINRVTLAVAGFLLIASFTGYAANAQESPPKRHDSGTAIPLADPAFKGVVRQTFNDSTADYPQPIRAPEGAPNVLLVILDDVGFGMCSTFGGPVPTPNLDKLAGNSLIYNRFHTTAQCSQTRAALLTGRNHHSAGTGAVIEMSTGFPGYSGIIPRSTALIAQILRDNGYATSMFGKWHNTPEREISPAGPFNRWPTGLGFDYFYGFNQGETDQYYPTLYRGTSPVPQPKSPEEGYHFTEDIADEAISWIQNVRVAERDKPWFCYFSTGAVHAPHHAPKEWIEKFKGKFDYGWDEQRKKTHKRQLALGVIPEGTELTPRHQEIPSWKSRSADEKIAYARLMENYAAFMAHTDHHVGRVIDSIEKAGELDNTLVLYIVGDNGASSEGNLEGTFIDLASMVGIDLGLNSLLSRLDDIGGPESHPHVPVGWAWAMSAPFQWTKAVPSHFGGTRNPLLVHWPNRIKGKGKIRSQFHHVIDVVPTILESCNLPAPKEVNGIKQKPIAGVSMVYSFDAAEAPGQRTTQYFEILGSRGIYHEGWFASARCGIPWETGNRSLDDLKNATWELYNIEEDFSQANDIGSKNPAKLSELKALFQAEAEKYDVLPLDPRFAERMNPALRMSGKPPTSWTYRGNNVWLPEPIGPQIFPRPHSITATVEIPESGAKGVIACAGASLAGWSLCVQDGKLKFHYQCLGIANINIPGTVELPKGSVTLKSEFRPDGSKEGGGSLRLFVNDKSAGEGKLKRTLFRHSLEPFEIGRDSMTPVNPEYKAEGAFEFTGKIDSVKFELLPPKD